ncbi:glycosyltransferase family 9 protein [soil metagenome]
MREISDYKNILVYRIGHLGDTIAALPAFWQIRDTFPDARITLLTNSDSKNKNYVMARNVLPERGLFDSFISYDNSAGRLIRIYEFAKLLLYLRSKKFDCLFYLSTRIRTDYQIKRDLKFFKTAGIGNIFGAKHLLKNSLNFDHPKPLPIVEPEYKFLLDCLPFETRPKTAKIKHSMALNENEKTKAFEWLKKNCGNDFAEKHLIAVAPGSKWDSKKWFEKDFTAVIQKLTQQYNVFPVIFGGKEDFETGQNILTNLKSGANAAGELNIRESSAALRHCRLYLGNDTGTMHLAAAVGVPCVALFAAIDFPGRWYPFGEHNKIFRHAVECEGCHTPDCFNNHKCLKLISSEKVFEACCRVLAG